MRIVGELHKKSTIKIYGDDANNPTRFYLNEYFHSGVELSFKPIFNMKFKIPDETDFNYVASGVQTNIIDVDNNVSYDIFNKTIFKILKSLTEENRFINYDSDEKVFSANFTVEKTGRIYKLELYEEDLF